MLDFPLFGAITSENSYSYIKDKYQTLYFSSSCLSKTLQFTDEYELEVDEISDIMWYISTGKSLIQDERSYK